MGDTAEGSRLKPLCHKTRRYELHETIDLNPLGIKPQTFPTMSQGLSAELWPLILPSYFTNLIFFQVLEKHTSPMLVDKVKPEERYSTVEEASSTATELRRFLRQLEK